MNITVINGPNLNMLGSREAAHYGTGTLADLEQQLQRRNPEISFTFYQSNHEGELISYIHRIVKSELRCDVLLANFGGFTHTSVAIRDALSMLKVPYIEVHLSNIHAREAFRHTSLTGGSAKGIIAGFGFMSYELAVDAALKLAEN
ncbi:MAG: 3-dehydroquinate dehydratase [Candidatus Cyclonatronum sp.]|uniref:type II 3-dehydroquinate dehydratase n=1 Tax=Cyclonatronum sp. TaxID=3024185 RepID=UPI0025BE5461|nr:type II 3-dehydroquinate dehydratase [Cyclonatronum sp.]MCC5934756.1 3-dehydroquinate dehydratase [Balneolales bacterium]MCH8487398.1 3-dehydroquinate dehydratase [Cyclonatronum sp.]